MITKNRFDETYYQEVAEIQDAYDKSSYEAKKNYDAVVKDLYQAKTKAFEAAMTRAIVRANAGQDTSADKS